MSRDGPDVDEILRTVDEFIASIVDRLDERGRYEALCARYLLDVGRRELRHGVQINDTEMRALQGLTGESGSLEELYGKLALSIRAGRYDERWPEAFELVFEHVINKVAVSRPDKLEDQHSGAVAAERRINSSDGTQ
jgi:hypothetical protein